MNVSSSLNVTTSNFTKIRVLNASTGVSYPISLHPNELTIQNIRRHLAAFVPINDQILLLGPPYKVPKDSTLRSEETLAALRQGDLEDDPNYFDYDDCNDDDDDCLKEKEESPSLHEEDEMGSGGTTTDAGAANDGSIMADGTQQQHDKQSSQTGKINTTSLKDSKNNQKIKTMTTTTTGRKGNKRRIKKSILSATEKTGARRLFLFSKQALSESAPDPNPCILQPMELVLPTEPDPSPILLFQNTNSASTMTTTTASTSNPNEMISTTPTSPLHKALQVYERQFSLHYSRGRALADGADMRLATCRTCVSEQAVMARALRAAVSNLSDHRNSAARTRLEFTSLFQTKTGAHSALLQNFEGHLSALMEKPLHPALVAVARANGRIMETLLDTVPVDRERAWFHQCQLSLQRLLTLFEELNNSFKLLGTSASREEEAKEDFEAEEAIKELSEKVEGTMMDVRDLQAERFARLTMDHKKVVSVVLNAISDDGKAQAAFSTLENMSKASKDILPSMESDDVKLKELMGHISESKTAAMKRMKMRLRQVSVAQSTIQKVLSSVNVQRDALTQLCESMTHLEHVQEFSTSYRDFLSEIRRRRAYGDAVTSSANAMIERLAAMRIDEVKAREKFLRGPGRHLMPAFFEMFVPTLTTPPPLFTPQLPALVEMDTLPDFGPEEIKLGDGNGSGVALGNATASPMDTDNETPVHGNIATDTRGASDASSLTESLPTQQVEKSDEIAESEKPRVQDESLIVSADEASGNDVIMGMESQNDGGSQAEADAKQKTLAYENAILRQALERMGGKSPRSYLEEARKQCSPSEEKLQLELTKVRTELEETKTKLEKANKALEEIRKDDDSGELCGKISHSNIKVGDIALFIPIERKSRGKQDYLAFHTNSPQKYLSPQCIEGKPTYVLGKVIYEKERIAGAKGTDENPHGLPPGTKFWDVDVEVLRTS